MLLDINEDFKLVYDLSIEIERDPSFMHLVQQVTLDPAACWFKREFRVIWI